MPNTLRSRLEEIGKVGNTEGVEVCIIVVYRLLPCPRALTRKAVVTLKIDDSAVYS